MGCSNDIKSNSRENTSEYLKKSSKIILKENFFYKIKADSLKKYGFDIKSLTTENDLLNYFTTIKIPKAIHSLLLRIFVEVAKFISCESNGSSNNVDNLSMLMFEILGLFLSDYNSTEISNERKRIIYSIFELSKYEVDDLDTSTVKGYNFEMFLNNIEGLLDFLITVLIYYILLLVFLPKKEKDLEALFEGKEIAEIKIATMKYDIGLKINKITKDSDWKVIKEKCLDYIFNPIQECKL